MEFTPLGFTLRDGRKALLRAPCAGDAAGTLSLVRAIAAETHFLMREPEEWEHTPVETEAAYLQARRDDPNCLMLMCEVDGEIVGDCHIVYGNRMKTSYRASVGIGVRKAYWGQGIGSKMFEIMIAHARKREGMLQIELEFIEGNSRGQRLYEKFGFRVTSVQPDAVRLKDGSLRNLYWMILKL